MNHDFVRQLQEDGFDEAGYVYLIRLLFRGYSYKIGRSKDPQRRLKQLSVPGDLDLMHWIETDDMGFAEGLLHDIFDRQRIKGEWFDLEFDNLLFILCIDKVLYYTKEGDSSFVFRDVPALSLLHEVRHELEPEEYARCRKLIHDWCNASV